MDGRSILVAYIEAALANSDYETDDPTDAALRTLGQGSDATMISTNYDPEADVLHIKFGPEGTRYDNSQEVAPGVFVAYGTDGKPIGVEVISVRARAAHATKQLAAE